MAGPQYTKRISNQLSISLSYVASEDPSKVECLISFKNISNHNVVINPEASQEQNGNGSWLSSMFGEKKNSSNLEKEKLTLNTKDAQPLNIFLGYVQLFGYVVCNYKFELNDGNAISSLGGDDGTGSNDEGDIDSGDNENEYDDSNQEGLKDYQLWSNKDYIQQYNNDDLDDQVKHEGWPKDLKLSEILDTTPFISQSYKDRMIIGGKIGGIEDLVVVDEDRSIAQQQQQQSKQSDGKFQIDKYKRSLLQDLVAGFNTFPEPTGNAGNGADGIELIREISDAILPFYATSQSLLFSDVSLKKDETKLFRIQFPRLKEFPPSYNTKSTGMTGDQGLLSIRYQLAVGLSEMNSKVGVLQPRTVYFPYEVRAEYVKNDESYLLPDYLRRTTIDQSWKVLKIENEDEKSISKEEDAAAQSTVEEDIEKLDKQSFLEDLTNLIDSDLRNMPLISSTERRKSIPAINENAVDGLNPQLPKHLKTQYQIRLNNKELCLVSIKKPYYHLGEDINFVIDAANSAHNGTRIVGTTAHLEAHEVFHCKIGKSQADKDYTNIFKVSPYLKINSFASSMTQSTSSSNASTTLMNGSINIPNYLTTQFQSSRLFDLQYFLVFKFVLKDFFEEEENTELEANTVQRNENIDSNEHEETLLEATPRTANDVLPRDAHDTQFSMFRKHHIDNTGSEFKFKLPINLI
ncbi:hypothetical protein CLIB1423_14S03312 [[Candida] railenensis]|uniref:Uncharacterized protein n=1 Tax=[Candida] railenensis TaxID=45579 RepID=A0A9P0QRG2_9ASCO|nr:hypothetical protein CLIB1423_14S03312 [[Candida] railenensis]